MDLFFLPDFPTRSLYVFLISSNECYLLITFHKQEYYTKVNSVLQMYNLYY
jgi:hypothetical protein